MSAADTARCSICGKPLDEWDKQENFGFDYHVGYGSKYDGDHIHARFCCGCFDKIIDVLRETSVICPISGESELDDDSDIDTINIIDE